MTVIRFQIEFDTWYKRFSVILFALTLFIWGCQSKPESNCKRGDYDCFLVEYNRKIELDPVNADAYYKRGLLFEAKNDMDNAIADFSKAISLEARAKLEAVAHTCPVHRSLHPEIQIPVKFEYL